MLTVAWAVTAVVTTSTLKLCWHRLSRITSGPTPSLTLTTGYVNLELNLKCIALAKLRVTCPFVIGQHWLYAINRPHGSLPIGQCCKPWRSKAHVTVAISGWHEYDFCTMLSIRTIVKCPFLPPVKNWGGPSKNNDQLIKLAPMRQKSTTVCIRGLNLKTGHLKSSTCTFCYLQMGKWLDLYSYWQFCYPFVQLVSCVCVQVISLKQSDLWCRYMAWYLS